MCQGTRGSVRGSGLGCLMGVLFLSLLPLATCPTSAPGAQRPTATYSYPDGGETSDRATTFMPSSEGGVRIGGACASFTGAFGPWTFFGHLKRKDGPGEPKFRVGRRPVFGFPDEVSLFVIANNNASCTASKRKRVADWSHPLQMPEAARSPRVQAGFTNGLRLEPVEADLVREGDCRVFAPFDLPREVREWCYTLRLKTAGVPLTNALVVTLFARDGTKLATFTYRP